MPWKKPKCPCCNKDDVSFQCQYAGKFLWKCNVTRKVFETDNPNK